MSRARPKKRVLFVCRENRVRSLTAEQIYRGRPDLEVRSAGIAEYAAVPLTRDLVEWADQVFVFTKQQRKVVEERYADACDGKTVVCLHLPDIFEYKSPKLIMKLTGKLAPYLGSPVNNEGASAEAPLTPPVMNRPAISPRRNSSPLLRNVFGLFSGLLSGAKDLRPEPSA